MIDLPKIGAYLSYLRKAKNLTQAELADQLNISHQAVSKWERGESMPDIGLLPQIASLFGITVDDLLRGEGKAPSAPHADVSTDAIRTEVQRPEETETGFESAAEAIAASPEHVQAEVPEQAAATGTTAKGRFQARDVIRLAPFLGTEVLEEMVLEQLETDQIDWPFIKGLAPFIGNSVLDRLVRKLTQVQGAPEIRYLLDLAPFLGKEKVEELVQQAEEGTVSWDIVQRLAPFIGKETMGRLVQRVVDGNLDVERILKLAPFLGKENIGKLLNDADPDSMSPDLLVKLAPFVDKETLGRLVKRQYNPSETVTG